MSKGSSSQYPISCTGYFCRGGEANDPHWLWDVEIAWYFPSAIQWFCLYGLKHGLEIHNLELYLTLSNCLPLGQNFFLIIGLLYCGKLAPSSLTQEIYGSHWGILPTVPDCDLVESSNPSHAITLTFRLISNEKAWTLLTSGYGLNSTTTALLQGTIYQPLRSGRIWHKVNF